MKQTEAFEDFMITRKTHTGLREEAQQRFHRFHELYYVLEGKCSVLIGQRICSLQAGDVAVIPVRTLHKTDYLSSGPNTKYVISLTEDMARSIDAFLGEELTPVCLDAGQVTIPLQRRELIQLLLARMLYEYENRPPHAASIIKACLTQFLTSLYLYRTQQEEKADIPEASTERIHGITDYLYEHYSENLSLPQLAEHFALSPSYLSRSFKKAAGLGLREYLVNLRIQQACELLLSTSLSVTEIADRCGFNDSNYFGDAFKKATGLSPRDYRRLS